MQWILLVGAVTAALTVGITVRAVQRRRRRPRTVEETASAARRAMRELRRSSPRPGRDIFERGPGVPDRHSAAILENVTYGDAASFDSGGGGDGGGGTY
ncbi:hypothetical protein [Micromonospora humi]|nr:hypothetical protein [Micromonospora humi]